MIPFKIGFTRLEEEEEEEEEKPLVNSVVTGKSDRAVTENDGNSVSAASGKQVVTAKVTTACSISFSFDYFGILSYFVLFFWHSSFYFSSVLLFRFILVCFISFLSPYFQYLT
jgi:hypothetical protein